MKKEMIFKKVVAGIGSAALAIALSACAHHDASKAEGYGQIRTEGTATTDSTTAVVGTAPAPKNAEGVSGTTTPAVISGPAAVDSDGRAYTSSAAGGNGNAANLGNNTNVNLIPKKVSSSSSVVVTEAPVESTTTTVVSNSPAPIQPMITETPAPAPVIVETPAPAPVIVETPAPAPVIVETPAPAPMASSTVDETPATTKSETPKHHRKMHKD
jgi:hypothetical protein